MKASLKPGLRHTHRFVVPPSRTVPALYPEAPEFVAMPEVFASGSVAMAARMRDKAIGDAGRVEHSEIYGSRH